MGIFGRTVPAHYNLLESEIERLHESHCCSERAIGENLAGDERVSDQRATRYFDCCSSAGCTAIAALNERSMEAGTEILNVSLNRKNIAYLPNEVANPELPASTRLITVLRIFPSLANWIRSFHLDREIEAAGDDLDGSVADSVADWLRECETSDENMEILRQDIANAHRVITEPRRRDKSANRSWQQNRIVWVALEDEFSPVADEGVRSWLEALGIGNMLDTRDFGKNASDDWFVLLSYSLARTSGLARPTVLDAGAYAWHYPSPADLPAHDGGRTVILRDGLALAPLREFVHTTRRISRTDVQRIRQFRPSDDDLPDLDAARTRHVSWIRANLVR